jgi:hypothetical protein
MRCSSIGWLPLPFLVLPSFPPQIANRALFHDPCFFERRKAQKKQNNHKSVLVQDKHGSIAPLPMRFVGLLSAAAAARRCKSLAAHYNVID